MNDMPILGAFLDAARDTDQPKKEKKTRKNNPKSRVARNRNRMNARSVSGMRRKDAVRQP